MLYSQMMASTTQPHPSFPSRPFSSTLHGKLPERNVPFGSTSHTANRENLRLERERQERERAAASAGPQNPFPSITDEQKEEINEAVSSFPLGPPKSGSEIKYWFEYKMR